MNISPIIQARVRQLLGLTGGPSIEAIEAVQPVAIIAGYPEGRQPQSESGDMIVRRFQGGMYKAPVALNNGSVSIRVTDPNTVLWIQRIFLTNTAGAAMTFLYGRGPNVAAGAWGTLVYLDWRLPGVDLGTSLAELHSSHQVGIPIPYGRVSIAVPIMETVIVPVDITIFSGASTGVYESLHVTAEAISTGLGWVAFEGIAFSRG